MQSNLLAPLPPLSLSLTLFIPSLSVLLSKICHIKKKTHTEAETAPTKFTTMNQQFGASTKKRARERERSALPCRRRKSFVLPSPRVASALLGCCCCCWSLRTATAAAAVQFCFQRRHDWTRALQESRTRTLNSTELSSTTTLCVCVSLCTRVCAYVSRCCVCPSRQCRKKL